MMCVVSLINLKSARDTALARLTLLEEVVEGLWPHHRLATHLHQGHDPSTDESR